jgi:hypothetical protein
MESIDTELTTAEIAARLAAKKAQTWTYTSSHGKTCEKCVEAVESAESFAIVRGSVSSTYTLSYPTEDHAGTATRVQ